MMARMPRSPKAMRWRKRGHVAAGPPGGQRRGHRASSPRRPPRRRGAGRRCRRRCRRTPRPGPWPRRPGPGRRPGPPGWPARSPKVHPASRVMVRMASWAGLPEESEVEVGPEQRGDQQHGLDDHAEGGAEAEQDQAVVVGVDRGQARVGDQGVEPEQDGDHHQVVGDGDEHRRGELAPGVQQGGEQGDEPVAGQLGDEPAQQEDGHLLLLVRRRRCGWSPCRGG